MKFLLNHFNFIKPEYFIDQFGIGISLKAPKLALLASAPEYADKKEGNNTDWLFLPNPNGKPSKFPFSKLFGFEKSIPAWAANLLEIINLLDLNVSNTSELYSSLFEKAVFIRRVEILKFPIEFWINGL